MSGLKLPARGAGAKRLGNNAIISCPSGMDTALSIFVLTSATRLADVVIM